MKKALVTGDAGFIGRHISARLAADGWQVSGLDIARHWSQDCRDFFGSSEMFDLVVHCAAVVGGRLTIEGQPMQVATDLAIDSDFFQFIDRTRPARAVYFSSSAAYPIALQDGHQHIRVMDGEQTLTRTLRESDIDLDDAEQPDAVYGWAKLTGEQIARYTDQPVHVFRPFSGYGSDQSLDYPFPSFINRAIQRVEKFDVWGSGTQVRDWVHVDDICEAVIKSLDHEADTWNICTGIDTSMIDLAHQVMRAAGHEVKMLMHPDLPSGVQHRVGNPTKMFEIHRPTVSLAEGIERALLDRSS